MNKKKDKKNLKKIISITKAKSTNKFPINQKRQNNKIKHISNINLENEKNDYFKENIKNNEKRLEISKDKENKYTNNKDSDDGKNYYDFKAHFKYNDLVEALNLIKEGKNENMSNRPKTKSNKKDFFNNNNQNNNKIVISRNFQMNNYVKYNEFIENSKNNAILTNIPNKIWKNKTSYFPQTELIKKNMIFKFKKSEEKRNINEKISESKSKSKSKSKEKKYINKSGKISKENNINYNRKKYYNLITISLINKQKIKNHVKNKSNSISNNKNNKSKNEDKSNSHPKNRKLMNYKSNSIKKKTFQNSKLSINNIVTNIELSNNIKSISKQSREKNQFINKIEITKAKPKTKIKNLFNINYNYNKIISSKEKAHSSSLSRTKNKKNNIISKNKDIYEINNIRTYKKGEISKIENQKDKTNIINVLKNNSKNKANNFKKHIISSKNSKNIFKHRINKKDANSIKSFLTINDLNNNDNNLKNSKPRRKPKTKSNSKNKDINKIKQQIKEKLKSKQKELGTYNINKIKKYKTLFDRGLVKWTNEKTDKKYKKNFNKKNVKIRKTNRNILKNQSNYYNSFQISKENIKTESRIISYKNTRINSLFNDQIYKRNNKNRKSKTNKGINVQTSSKIKRYFNKYEKVSNKKK